MGRRSQKIPRFHLSYWSSNGTDNAHCSRSNKKRNALELELVRQWLPSVRPPFRRLRPSSTSTRQPAKTEIDSTSSTGSSTAKLCGSDPGVWAVATENETGGKESSETIGDDWSSG
ncbi:hypothetical protein BDW72DRAFT_60322 [Aspergillus terricola var. indicus]